MIETGYRPLIEPEAEDVDISLTIHPLVNAAVKLGAGLVKDIAQEIIEPEMQPQPGHRKASRTEKDALDIALAQIELDILDAKSPTQVMSRFLDHETQQAEDTHRLADVRTELRSMTQQPIFMEPRDFVQQQAISVKAMPQSESVTVPIVQSIPVSDAA